MKFKYFFLFLFSFCTFSIYAQSESDIDSLIQLSKKEKRTVEKARLFDLLSQIYRYKDLQKAIEYNQKATHLIPKDSFDRLGNTYVTRGNMYGHIGNFPKALYYLDSAIVFFTQADSLHKLAVVYNNISTVYLFMSSFQKSAKYLYKSIHIHEQFGNTRGLAYSFSSLAALHSELKEFDLAIKTGKMVMEKYFLDDEFILTGNTALNLGLTYSCINNPDSALFYLNQALDLYEEGNHLRGVTKIYSEKSYFYLKHQQLDSAKLYIYKALSLEENVTDQYQKLEFQMSLANIFFYEKKYSESIALYDTIKKIAHEIPYKLLERDALEGLIDNYEALEQHQKVTKYLRAYITLKDTIFNAKKQEQIKNLEIKHETQKKEQAIVLLAKDRDIHALNAYRNWQWAYSAFVILALVLVVSFLLLRQNRLRATQKTTQLKHQLLRNQMNPHFIFNALTAIQSYIYENNPKEAGLYLSAFAKLVRAILENSRKEYITLDKELQWLQNYLKLQLVRFDHQFEYQIHVDDQLDTYELLIPPMLTQPFIENALEHGLKNIDYKGKINIQFVIDKEEQLKINIEDNGVGYKRTKSNTLSTHDSLATKITKERLSFLNKNRSNNIHFAINSKAPSGTIISFTIPIKYI